MAKVRSYAERRLAAELGRFVRTNKPLDAVLVAGIAGMAVVATLTQRSTFLQGIELGFSSAVFLGMFVLIFLVSTGAMFTLAGIWAESFTRDELKRAKKQGLAWGSVSNIEIGSLDIDHLVVTPGGVIAIETKMRTSNIEPARKTADLMQARYTAGKAASVLRSMHVQMPSDVTPALVVWGRASRSLPDEGIEVDGFHVLPGAGLSRWLERHSTGRLSQDQAETMLSRELFKSSRVVKTPVLREH